MARHHQRSNYTSFRTTLLNSMCTQEHIVQYMYSYTCTVHSYNVLYIRIRTVRSYTDIDLPARYMYYFRLELLKHTRYYTQSLRSLAARPLHVVQRRTGGGAPGGRARPGHEESADRIARHVRGQCGSEQRRCGRRHATRVLRTLYSTLLMLHLCIIL